MINRLLGYMLRLRMIGLLRSIIYLMYKIKGKDVRSVTYFEKWNGWEFVIGKHAFYSSGPGWAYDEEFLLRQFKKSLGKNYTPKPGDVVIDVGAGVGEETWSLSKQVGPTGRVIAIEAHPDTVEILRRNVAKNNLENVTIVQAAISDSPGSLFMETAENSLASKSSVLKTTNSFEVRAITFDDLVKQFDLSTVDFVKVNIEGAEQLMIRGAEKTIDRVNNVAISCHDFLYERTGEEFYRTKDKVLAFLQRHGYEVRTGDQQHGQMFDDYVYGIRPSHPSTR